MRVTNDTESKRLMLKIERDLLAQSQLKVLLTEAASTVAGDRQNLRSVKSRLEPARRANRTRRRP